MGDEVGPHTIGTDLERTFQDLFDAGKEETTAILQGVEAGRLERTTRSPDHDGAAALRGLRARATRP
jgi:hypothetical protein